MSTHIATAYLVIKASRGYGVRDEETGLRPVNEIRAVAMRKSRPRTLDPDEIALKVRVQVPDTAFDPLAPDALIVVPEEMAIRGPITTEVDEPEEEVYL